MKFLSDKTKEGVGNYVEMLVISATRHYHDLFQSPIEAMLFEAIAARQFCCSGKIPRISVNEAKPYDGDWTITPQAQIGSFRVDFLIKDAGTGIQMVVECDGHDFHERTKEQARKDRSRDRELQSLGYLVLRYTGSEIWRDPWACAEDIEAKLYAFHYAREKASADELP